jgi:hypothetical protein
MPKSNKPSVYLTEQSMGIIGGRDLSVFVNQSLSRLKAAGDHEEITELMRQIVKKYKKGNRRPYPDQNKALQEFSNATGRTLAESVVLMDMVERE